MNTILNIPKELDLNEFFHAKLELLCVLDLNSRFVKVNARWQDLFGYCAAELQNKELFNFIHVKDIAATNAFFHTLSVESNDVFDLENRFRCKDGAYRKLAWRLIRKGGLLYASAQDITCREQEATELRDSQRRLFAAQSIAHVGNWELDLNSKKVWTSSEALRIYGLPSDSPFLALDCVRACALPQYRKVLDAALKELIRGGGDYQQEFMIRRPENGEIRIVFSQANLEVDESGQPIRVLGVIRDITENRLYEKKLAENEERFRSVIEFSQDAFYRRNLYSDHYDYLSPVFEKLTGYPMDDFVRMSVKEIRGKNHPADIQSVNKYLAEKIICRGSGNMEYRYLCKNGEYRWFSDTFTIVEDESTKQVYIYGAVHDISAFKKHEEEINYNIYHDSLTNLFNRRFLDEELIRMDKRENLPISVIMGDVNGLKMANDSYGHQVGDQILMKVASILTQQCRPTDIIARWGGDEFIVLLPKTTMEETNQIVKSINEVCANEQIRSIAVSISLGFETKTRAYEDINQVMKKAEDYMYKHKTVQTSSMRGRSIDMMLNTLYEKNIREEQHARRVSDICAEIGTEMGLPETVIKKLKAIGLMHDIGKIALDEEILNKNGRLTENEWKEIRRHCEVGYRILSANSEMSEIADLVVLHHERLDGSGYPYGLKGDQIPLISRILAVADSYDAMTSERTYRFAIPKEEAIDELRTCTGRLFDPDVVKAFVKVLAVG